jgi:hypothetical protein
MRLATHAVADVFGSLRHWSAHPVAPVQNVFNKWTVNAERTFH